MKTIKIYTDGMLNCTEIIAAAVLIASENRSRITDRHGEPVMNGVIDTFKTDKGNTIRIFTSLAHVDVSTDIEVSTVVFKEIFWRVFGRNHKVGVVK